MFQPVTEASLVRPMIVQIFMKRRRDGVLDGASYRVGGKSCTQTFAKTRGASSVIPWMTGHLSYCRAADHPSDGSFTEGRMLPMLPVRMFVTPRSRNRRIRRNQ